ncbi:MAG: lactococcin 972 family bacteriocin [Streptococcaceae bacterium]|nr:lactococcin 972 family bacteriocin [Streptococcaceae bacterium]
MKTSVTRKAIKKKRTKKMIFVLTLAIAVAVPSTVGAYTQYMRYGTWSIFDSGAWPWQQKTGYSNYLNTVSTHASWVNVGSARDSGSALAGRWSYSQARGAWNAPVNGDYISYNGRY